MRPESSGTAGRCSSQLSLWRALPPRPSRPELTRPVPELPCAFGAHGTQAAGACPPPHARRHGCGTAYMSTRGETASSSTIELDVIGPILNFSRSPRVVPFPGTFRSP